MDLNTQHNVASTRLLFFILMQLKGIFCEIESILFASSKSQSLIVPLAAPAATKTSEESKLTESMPLVCPDKLYNVTQLLEQIITNSDPELTYGKCALSFVITNS